MNLHSRAGFGLFQLQVVHVEIRPAQANEQANPELMRLALKLATGAGKATVMAMLIAWQTVNAVRHPNSKAFSSRFLIVSPGITIRDRLRVLMSDFSLMDAIECGIVKLPRVPVADNIPGGGTPKSATFGSISARSSLKRVVSPERLSIHSAFLLNC